MELSPLIVALILLAVVFIFLVAGMWIGVGLGIAGFIGLAVFLPGLDVVIPAIISGLLTSYTLAAIPLFMFMGQIILRSGLNKRLYRGVNKWVGVIPGGLVHSNILSCSIFAACSGSSVATAATMAEVAYPEQVQARQYDAKIVCGSLAAGGTLGILIPPSITMIIYGGFVDQSVGKLFMGGVVPGIVTALLFMLYIFVMSIVKPHIAPGTRQKVTFRYFLNAVGALKDIWPVLVLIVFIMGSIYGGICTPTEAGAVASFMALVIAASFKELNFRVVKEAAMKTIGLAGMVGMVLIGARLLGYSISFLKVPTILTELIVTAEIDRMAVWFLVILLYLVLGCFLEGISLMLLTIPIVYPLLIQGLGFDPIWFGVLLTMLVECAIITPPVGMNLYVLQGITKEELGTIILGTMPFFGVLLVSIVIFTFAPQAVLFLPNMMFAPRW